MEQAQKHYSALVCVAPECKKWKKQSTHKWRGRKKWGSRKKEVNITQLTGHFSSELEHLLINP